MAKSEKKRGPETKAEPKAGKKALREALAEERKAPEFRPPFGGAVSRFIEKDAPPEIRHALEEAGKNDLLDPAYPYAERISLEEYRAEDEVCQLELIKVQSWLRATGQRIVLVFEGRDAAGKGGTIKALTENLNPRRARVVALPAPDETERGQWYFQRYIEHLPSTGEMVLFDRSWYNRAVVEHVFGWVTPAERERFFAQLPEFEDMLVRDGIILMKTWIAIGRAEQLRQFQQREKNPLKQWKLSQTDIDGLARWDDYTAAIEETFARSHSALAPWTVVWAEDKRRARIAAMRAILSRLDYPDKAVTPPDPLICGGPEILRRREG
ncbi:polyphosphate kinase 2 [Amaricoccus solimangrovi]|uniref:ADP/GDP-polyphosphate phosphotransferase n=1 Tax=Amaricoccus solimangrovi TaxID=2589815 RepID=A0A501WWA2_9RHOB|nr:polyphosphate kinase 2 [Amaricoccus solimangrovi]TPE53728.1 polyphosphate kinase 2 [Amaricoccus solimangrovi]